MLGRQPLGPMMVCSTHHSYSTSVSRFRLAIRGVSVVQFRRMRKKIVSGLRVASRLLLGKKKRTQGSGAESAAPPPPPDRRHVPSWSVVLDVSSDAGPAEIRAAYRSLMAKYHPDKLERFGAEFRSAATERSKEITTAYREAMRARGFSA